MDDLLNVEKIESSYDNSRVLFGITIRIGVGEMVTLLGRNGMGKTSTIRSIMGLLKPHSGEIYFKGKAVTGYPSYKVCLLYTSPSPRDLSTSRMPSSA